MSMSDIAMLIIVSTTSLGGCLGFIMYHIRRSRCKSVECCCINCKRDVMTNQEMTTDQFQGMKPPAFAPMMRRGNAPASGPPPSEIRVDNDTELYDDVEMGCRRPSISGS